MYNHPDAKLLWKQKKKRWRRKSEAGREKDGLLIVLWLINRAIDQSVCSRRGTYTGSWMVGNNLSSYGVNPSKRGGCGLIVRWVRGMGGFLHHAEMINAAVRLCHKHNSCSKCLNGYEWFCLCACVSVHMCAIMGGLEKKRYRMWVNLNFRGFVLLFLFSLRKVRRRLIVFQSYTIICSHCTLGTMQHAHTFLDVLFLFFPHKLLHTVWVGPETVPEEARSCDHLQHPIWDSLS